MVRNTFLKISGLGLTLMTLHGCASHNIQVYSQEHSRAWNLTHSVGLTDLEDTEIPESQKDSLLYDSASLAIDSSLWTSNYGLAMDCVSGQLK